MGLKELYSTNPEAEEEGAWVAFGDGVELCIRSIKSKRLKSVMESHRRRFYRKGFTNDAEDEVIATELSVAAVSEWRGVTDDDNKSLPFSTENVKAVMRRYAWLREDVVAAMRSRETFRVEDVQTQGKDSATPSGDPSAPAPTERTSSGA